MAYSGLFIVKGQPQALARVRVSQGKFYDSQKQFKLNYGLVLDNQHDGKRLFKGPLLLEVIFFMDVFKAAANRREKIIDTYHFSKPDTDNLLKYLCDSANKVLFQDDALISEIRCKKIWSTEPRTEFTITELE